MVDGLTLMRPTRIAAPAPAGVNCTASLVRGCQALTFGYATVTTATATVPADYVGRLKEVTLTTYNPATSAMVDVVVARYAYNSAGRLAQAWDPRLDWTDISGTRHLAVQYSYQVDGVLATMTPPGQEPWQFGYTTLPSDAGKGRLATVTRSALSAGTAITTVVYKIPVTGAGAPYDLSAAQTARWGQAQAPADATAIFPATQVPSGNQQTGTMPSSYERASISYLDSNARPVNDASPGGGIDTTWYGSSGNTVRQLTAGNRSRALAASGSDSAAVEANIAASLSTVSIYSADGRRVLETLSPERDVVLGTGVVVRGRAHTVTAFDEGAPTTGAPFDLPTTETTSVRYVDSEGYTTDGDKRITKTEYDWTLRAPVVETVDPAGLALTTRTAYDSEGNVISTTSAAGGTSTTTPATRRTVSYRAGTGSGYTECDSRPEWEGAPCLVQAGGQPSSGQELPYSVTTYNLYGAPLTITEKTSGGVLRTNTIVYDAAGRPITVAGVAAGLGQALETRRTVYDSATGLAVRTQTLNGAGTATAEVVRAYDTLGRLVSYTDATGNASTMTYDVLSRVLTTNDGIATRSYSYDGGAERRGLATSVNETSVGTFTAAYDTDGVMVSQAWPNGVNVASTFDEEGTAVGLTYTQPSCGQPSCVLYTESTKANAQGLRVRRLSTLSNQDYRFDSVGRLTGVSDIIAGQCTSRSYLYDRATNRTKNTVYLPGVAGACQTTAGSTTATWTYDEADRATPAGYGYDALGRTVTLPGTDSAVASGGQVAIGYHTNDMVRSITQGTRTATYTLDVVSDRVRSWTDSGLSAGATKVHHYANDDDVPAWTDEGTSSYSKVVRSLGGAVATRSTGGTVWTLANLGGDTVAGLVSAGFGLAFTSEQTELGQPRNTADAGVRRYGWLGNAQRQADTPGGLVLMGARLYATGSGRFLSVDPVYGGNSNGYEYCSGDAINCTDTSGEVSCRTAQKRVSRIRWTPIVSFRVKVICSMKNWEVKLRFAIAMGVGMMLPLLGAAAGTIIGALAGPPGAAAGIVAGAIVGAAIGAVGVLIAVITWFANDIYDNRCQPKGIWFSAGATGYASLIPRPWVIARPYGVGMDCNSRK